MTDAAAPTASAADVVLRFSRLFDCESRPIFEGDVLAFTVGGSFEPKCVVIRDGDAFQKWYSGPREPRTLNEYDIYTLKMKVIGNVFENTDYFGICEICSEPLPLCGCG